MKEQIHTKTKFQRWYPWLLVVAGIIGLIASFAITVEKIELLENPSYQLACDINPIISCGSVMQSEQANAFGFANPLIGLMAFPVLIAIGLAMFAGATFKRWYWLGIQAGTVFGLLFTHWLIFQALYTINALCPYCMVVWAMVIPIFWYTLLFNLREGHIKMPQSMVRVGAFMQRHHFDVMVVWFLIITGLIIHNFWYYFSTLL